MMLASDFAYVQARLQARLGMRPGAGVWEGLRSLNELPAWLEQARVTTLKHWLASIGPTTPPHEIERLLRRHLRDTIEEVAHWMPSGWRAAVRWTAILPDLPALAHLLRGGDAHDWMREEPAWRELADAEPTLRARMLARGPWAALAAAQPDTGTLFDNWLAEWRRLHPDHAARVAFDRLTALLAAHRIAFLQLAPDAAEDARRTLETRLERLFHRAFLTPVAAWAWLLLAALEFERVRGALLTRALFPSEEH